MLAVIIVRLTSNSTLTMAELVDEPGEAKKFAIVSGRHEKSTTKFFVAESASSST